MGEPASAAEGFSGADGRSTIFDYWGVPEHQKWLNQGKFDGGKLNIEQQQLRSFYKRLLNVTSKNEALRRGKFYELQDANNLGKEYDQRRLYSYLRYTDKQVMLVVVNFSADKGFRPTIVIPAEVMTRMGLNTKKFYTYTDVLNEEEPVNSLYIKLPPLSARIFELKEIPNTKR